MAGDHRRPPSPARRDAGLPAGRPGAGACRRSGRALHVVLIEPQIAPNTGSIIRLCANTGAALHLVEPLGFELDDARLRRGGLDYHEYASLTVDDSVGAAQARLPGRWLAFSASASRRYTEIAYRPDDVLVFGTERTGLRAEVLDDARIAEVATIPMAPGGRSLNLANAVSVVVYEAWRQLGFPGAGTDPARPGQSTLTVEALGEAGSVPD